MVNLWRKPRNAKVRFGRLKYEAREVIYVFTIDGMPNRENLDVVGKLKP